MAPAWAFPVAMTLAVLATNGTLAQSPWPSPTQPQTAPAWPSSPTSVPSSPAPQAPRGAAPQAPSPSPAPQASFGTPQGGRNCVAEFLPLRQDTEKRMAAIKPATEKKSQQLTCAAFRNLAGAHTKMMKYADDHGVECRIPPDAMKGMRAENAKIVEIRNKVCSAGAAAAPPPPSLSDALGTSRLPDPSAAQTRRGGGTFDTLTGSPLAR